MEIILFSGWFQFVSGQAAIHSFGLTPFVSVKTRSRFFPTFYSAQLTDGNVITAPLRLGEWYGQLAQVEVLDKRTLKKLKFDLVLLPAFTITEDDVRAARKALSLDPLYALEIDLPAENADHARGLSILTGKPFAMQLEIPSGSRRVLIVCPKGRFHFALYGSAAQAIAARTFQLNGPERWERMSLGN